MPNRRPERRYPLKNLKHGRISYSRDGIIIGWQNKENLGNFKTCEKVPNPQAA